MGGFVVQLCDLAVHEAGGDWTLRLALLHMAAVSCTLAHAVWYFMRSVQVARTQTPAQAHAH